MTLLYGNPLVTINFYYIETLSCKSYHSVKFILSVLNILLLSKTLIFNKYYGNYLPQVLVRPLLFTEGSRSVRTEPRGVVFFW